MPAREFLERAETLGDPVPDPFRDGPVALPQRPAQVIQHAQVLQRMDVAGDAERHAAHHGATDEVLRQDRRIGVRLFEIFDDRERLAEGAVLVHERGHEALRVHLAIGIAVLLAAVTDQVHRHGAVGNALVRERDAYAPGRGTAEVREQLHRATTVCSRSATPSTPPRTRSPGFSAPTPAGVPVKIRSPAASSNQVESSAITSGTLQIMSAMSPCWRGSLLTSSQIRPRSGWPTSVTGEIAVSGAAWSKPFAVSQGLPCSFIAAWTSRRVRSLPTA